VKGFEPMLPVSSKDEDDMTPLDSILLMLELASNWLISMSCFWAKLAYFRGRGLGISEDFSSERLRIPCSLSELLRIVRVGYC